ncbi:MAG: acetyltransferase [Lachnospiraceae bacterium]
MEREKVLIVGAGGHAKVIIEAINQQRYQICGLLDKDDQYLGEDILGVKIIGQDSDAEAFYNEGITNAVIAVGHIGNFEIRERAFHRLKQIGFQMINVIHPKSCVSKSVIMGEGNVIMPGAVINAASILGNNNIVNTGAIIEHDVVLGDNVHLAPGTTTCGMVRIGNNTLIGAGTTIIQEIVIGSGVIVGAGSTVLQKIPDGVTAVGTPAKVLRRR